MPSRIIKKFDPEDWIARQIERINNARLEATIAVVFVCFKWASFFSSFNDLILQSKPIQWLWHQFIQAMTSLLPSIQPVLAAITKSLAAWAGIWRELLAPLRTLLSFLVIFHIHIPKIILEVISNVAVLLMLPTFALAVSWISSAKLRTQSKASRTQFDSKIEQTLQRREEILSGATRGKEFAESHGILDDVEKLAELIQAPRLNEAKTELQWLEKNGTRIFGNEYSFHYNKAKSAVDRLQSKKTFRILTDEPRVAAIQVLSKGRKARIISKNLTADKYDEMLKFMRQTPPPEPFVDPEIVSENLRLHHMQLAAAHYVVDAVKLSGALALSALVLRTIEWIWF